MAKEKEIKNKGYRNLKKNLKYFVRNKRIFSFVLLFVVISAGLSALVPIMYGQVLAKFSEYNGEMQPLIIISVITIAIAIGHEFCYRVTQLGFEKLYCGMLYDLRSDITKSALNITTGFHDKNSSGLFIQRMDYDTNKIADFYSEAILLIMKLIGNIAIVGYSIFLSPYLCLVLLVNVILVFIVENIQIKNVYRKRVVVRKKFDEITGFCTELLRGNRDIKALNIKDSMLKESDDMEIDCLDKEYNMFEYRNVLKRLNNVINAVCALAFGLLAVFLIKNMLVTVAGVLIIYLYRSTCLDFFARIIIIKEKAKEAEVSAARVQKVFDEYPVEKFGNKTLTEVKGNISIDNITFSYGKKRIINGLSANIPNNSIVAFVSKSGEGKSSLLNLFVRLYDPQHGKILLDGVDIKKLTKDSLRENVSLVSQNPYLFNLSFRENFHMVNPQVTDEQMIDACKRACIHDFIVSTTKGYDTIIGENGVQLSGGQRQRVSIARALIKNTKVIIFDESTSALDNESQEFVKGTISELKSDHTIIIVAHRLTTIKDCDTIYVLEKGKLIDSGTHRQLMKNCELYKGLYHNEGE